MLDFFSIFTKGGIVLWCFQGAGQMQSYAASINELIKAIILQERTGTLSYDCGNHTLKYRLDNEFDLVFVVVYQKILQLSYVDKFLNDIQLKFRDSYKNELQLHDFAPAFDFAEKFRHVLKKSEEWGRSQEQQPKQMKTFEDSLKSKKTIASMIEKKGGEKENKKPAKEVTITEYSPSSSPTPDDDDITLNRQKIASKFAPKKAKVIVEKAKSPKPATKKVKEGTVWEDRKLTKDDISKLDRTKDSPDSAGSPLRADYLPSKENIGMYIGNVKNMDDESDEEQEQAKDKKKSYGGMFSLFKGLVGSKTIGAEDMAPLLEKLKDNLIGKNVAADIAAKLCQSISVKLEGKVLGTFDSLASAVKTTLTDSLVQVLTSKRRIDILRDVLEAKKEQRPYVVAFCGVNGVGKSTNLAKICFWLIENNYRVLIAACDTFRAGAVEQLRTHMRHLNALHPASKHEGREMVQLYEKGYGKDAAGIALEAISFARDGKMDVVLIDTAGRMQDNEPLMRSLAKLIKVNNPDLVLFVGEALVGNEAVDQLVKFNQALADHSDKSNPHLIDGIVLTKFDTIDDKVGAAISMTYITGQPIVFVGTGQTYTDLRQLNAKAVVSALMK